MRGWMCCLLLFVLARPGLAASPKVYVLLWFDTEDYILPESDDAALRIAEFLTRQGIRGTFKIVGEKARTLARRGRTDVIAALKKHEIGYHSNWHSTQPTPAMYTEGLTWDDGLAEFERREGPGRDDVERIFGVAPSCYGQPGSSWCPQSYAACRRWKMIYLDAGRHVGLEGRPCYYGGVLNLYQLTHTMRADLNKPELLEKATQRFAEARQTLLAEGGGIVSVVYHPCEWVHKQFWDGVNFAKGANPPRSQWKLPPRKTADESRQSYRIFADYVAFMKRFDDVVFLTASEAARLYPDRAQDRRFTTEELARIARQVGREITYQKHDGCTLAASEIFDLLTNFVVARAADRKTTGAELKRTVLGPTSPVSPLTETVSTDDSQFVRTCADVAEYLNRHQRVPAAVWLGGTSVPPEAFLAALARVAAGLAEGRGVPAKVEVQPAKLTAAQYVADDGPGLWGWVIFPPGFRAPRMMAVARQQAWTLKPALLRTR